MHAHLAWKTLVLIIGNKDMLVRKAATVISDLVLLKSNDYIIREQVTICIILWWQHTSVLQTLIQAWNHCLWAYLSAWFGWVSQLGERYKTEYHSCKNDNNTGGVLAVLHSGEEKATAMATNRHQQNNASGRLLILAAICNLPS